jgi:hypothetical protein
MASQIDVIEIQVARKHDAHVGWPEEEKVKWVFYFYSTKDCFTNNEEGSMITHVAQGCMV